MGLCLVLLYSDLSIYGNHYVYILYQDIETISSRGYYVKMMENEENIKIAFLKFLKTKSEEIDWNMYAPDYYIFKAGWLAAINDTTHHSSA